jgi:hypothetical protein
LGFNPAGRLFLSISQQTDFKRGCNAPLFYFPPIIYGGE